MKIAKQKKSKAKLIIITAIVFVLLAGGYTAYAYYKDVWPFTSQNPLHSTTDKKDSSATNSEDENEMDPRGENEGGINKNSPKKDQDEALKEGNDKQGRHNTAGSGVSDTGGKDSGNQSGGVSSKSGKITLYTPKTNQKMKDGTNVSGKASVSTVQYRFSNPTDGQIAMGELKVKNGKFSGNISVQNAHSTKGTFEVFSFDSQGREVNNIKVNVKF